MAKKINVLEFLNKFADEHSLELQSGGIPGGAREPYEGELVYGHGMYHTIKTLNDHRRACGSRISL